MTRQTFRPIDEKHLASEAEILLWSPKMDLIAIANVQGEVALHRLSWKKVWVLAPPSDGTLVRSLAWRPDGKVLAVGYSSGRLLLCSTENKDILDTSEIAGPVDILLWVSEMSPPPGESPSTIYQDDSAEFLPRLPSLTKSYSSSVGRESEDRVEDAERICDRALLNLLVVASSTGRICLHAFGVISCLEHSLDPSVVARLRKVHTATLSDDFGSLFLVLELSSAVTEQACTSKTDPEAATATISQLTMITFQLPLLASRRRELHFLSVKYGHLSSLLAYLQSTVRSVTESWEDILLEIDSKLSEYAREKRRLGTGTVSDDFLELLMFGTPTEELHRFLLHDLTEKGLKKLSHSIELSYSNIQKLVLKHLQNVGHALIYHLADLKAMSEWSERFGALGLTTVRTAACLEAAGAFLLKATELQQVIDNGMKNFKAFFRWLYVVILRLSDEPVPAEINRITQQDQQFVAAFLKDNFIGDDDDDLTDSGKAEETDKHIFNLELVGQYLKNAPLRSVPDVSGNPWVAFLEAHPALKSDPSLFSFPYRTSLVQQHDMLQKEVGESLSDIAAHLGKTLRVANTTTMSDIPPGAAVRVRQVHVPAESCVYTIYGIATAPANPADHLVVVRQPLPPTHRHPATTNRVYFDVVGVAGEAEGKCSNHSILDFQFCSDETVSVLLLENRAGGLPVLAQVPIGNLLGARGQARVNGGAGLACGQFHRLEGVRGERIAVSGTRHLACVLFASRRRVRLFEMDVEDDEDDQSSLQQLPDDGDNANSSREETAIANDSLAGDSAGEDKENVK